MVQKLFKEISKENKIKEVLFKYFINYEGLPSNGYFLVVVISLSHQNKINKKEG